MRAIHEMQQDIAKIINSFYIQTDISQNEITKFLLHDPKLCLLGLLDDELDMLHSSKKYIMSPRSKYLGVRDTITDDLIAVVKMEQFSPVSICVHFLVSTDKHGTGCSDLIFSMVKAHIKDCYPDILKAITTVPSCCTDVMRAISRYGMKWEATIKNIAIWRKNIVDLAFYSLILKEEE